jgi:hypothetical protein
MGLGGWAALIIFVIIPIGIPVTIGARRVIVAWAISRHFKPVEGTVISSERTTEISEFHSDGGDLKTFYSYSPEVRFRYSVGGVEYDSGTYAHPATVSASLRIDQDRVDEIVTRYPVGGTFPAWYDPREPEVAYFYLDSPRGGLWTIAKTLLIAGAVFLGVMVVGVILSRR